MKTAHFLSKDESTSQDLSLAGLDYTFNFNQKRKIEQVLFKFSQAVSETVTISIDSALGAAYDITLQEAVLVGETSFVWRPQGECNLQKLDKLRVQCTNANLVGTCYAVVKSSEM